MTHGLWLTFEITYGNVLLQAMIAGNTALHAAEMSARIKR